MVHVRYTSLQYRQKFTRYAVKSLNLVHEGGGEDDLVVNRHTAPNQSGVSPLSVYSQITIVAVPTGGKRQAQPPYNHTISSSVLTQSISVLLENLRDFLCCLRSQQHLTGTCRTTEHMSISTSVKDKACLAALRFNF